MENTQLSSSRNQMSAEDQPQQVNSKNKKLLVAIVVSVLLTGVITGSAVYLWQKSVSEKIIDVLKQEVVSLEKQISTMGTEASPHPTPSPLLYPSPTTDPTANWKLYVDSQNKFEFLYPPTYTLGKLGDSLPLLNHKIYWNTSPYSYRDCRGDCAAVDSTEKVTVANQEAVKIKGWIGSVGGNIPQSYIKYEISIPGSDYLFFTLWELPQDGDLTQYAHDREIQTISQEEEAIFDQMLSTLQFLN